MKNTIYTYKLLQIKALTTTVNYFQIEIMYDY